MADIKTVGDSPNITMHYITVQRTQRNKNVIVYYYATVTSEVDTE